MSTYQQIRFSVSKDAIEDVLKLVKNYAQQVAEYAKKHDEEWTWSTFQSKDAPTDFVSVISHEDSDAEQRHMDAHETKVFAEKLYKHVTDNQQIAYELIASSEA